MNIKELRKLIKEEISNVLKEENSIIPDLVAPS
jgi:hypothetical protein